jgi:AcrR family transcriptional regulator
MKRPRGRPREFDEAVVLDKALDAFWNAGFEATSLDDLSVATGLARASIYAAFGDKETLYLRALAHFSKRMRALFEDAFHNGESLVEALTSFYAKAIALYFRGARPRGCLVMCTAAASAVTQPAIREALAMTLRATDDAFLWAFRRGQQKGEVPEGADVSVLAGIASSVLQSIALRARSGESRRRLESFARSAASMLCERSVS